MKKLFYITTFIFTVLFTTSVFGQTYSTTVDINKNNINARISNVGNNFHGSGNIAKFEFPKESGKHTIYANSLWVGGVNNGELYLSAEMYRQYGADYYPGPLFIGGVDRGTTTEELVQEWNHIWPVNRFEIEDFRNRFENGMMTGYTIPESISLWPANVDSESGISNKLAPYFDYNNDGRYNPEDGDYPLIKGDYAWFFIFNDAFREHTESGGKSLGIEVHGLAYVFVTRGDAFSNTIFMNYKIINRSTRIYHDAYIGMFTDFDIGNPIDDYLGCDIQRSCYYGYNGDDFDQDGLGISAYGEFPPAQAVVILSGAPVDNDGTDKPTSYIYENGVRSLVCDKNIMNGNINGLNFGDGISDNEIYGMKKFMPISYVYHTIPAVSFPETPAQYYNYLEGKWKDGSNLCYGGVGHSDLGGNPDFPTNYALPGNPSTDICNWGLSGIPAPYGWSEEYSGEGVASNAPRDVSGIGSSGPFTFKPGQEVNFEVAFVAGLSTDTEVSSVDLMLEYVDTIRNAYVGNNFFQPTVSAGSVIKENSLNNIRVYPNPANETVTVKISEENVKSAKIEIFDIQGKCVLTKTASNSDIDLNISNLPEGAYFIKVNTINKLYTEKIFIVR